MKGAMCIYLTEKWKKVTVFFLQNGKFPPRRFVPALLSLPRAFQNPVPGCPFSHRNKTTRLPSGPQNIAAQIAVFAQHI